MAFDFLKEIFGGSDTKQQQTSTPVDLTPQAFKNLQKPLATSLTGLVQGGFGAIPNMEQLSGGASAGMFEKATTETPEAQQLRDLLMQDATGASTGRQDYLQDVISGKYLPGQPSSNPFYDKFYEAAARPFSTEFERTVSRSLPSTFLAAGHQVGQTGETSSAFDRARGIATEGYANSLKDLAAQLGFQTHEAERGRQQEAVQLNQADADLMIKNYEAQLLPTFIAQWGVDQGLKEYQTRVAAALDILKTAAAVTQPTISSRSQGTSVSDTATGVVPALGTIFNFGGKA